MKKIKILFITDPWSTLHHDNDSSLRIMTECHALGAQVFWCSHHDISIIKSKTMLNARIWNGSPLSSEPGSLKELSFFGQIHYRVDPPVDEKYLHPLLMLRAGASRSTEFVNPIDTLLTTSEKLVGIQNPKTVPGSLVSANVDLLIQGVEQFKDAVIKPLNGAQSKGVHLFRSGEISPAVIRTQLLHLTQGQTLPVVVQKFMPEIEKGETRLWFVDLKLVAYARKKPATHSPIIDMDRGSTLEPHRLTAAEKRMVTPIRKTLDQLGVRLAAVDLIGSKITDFNITSPGLVAQIEKCTGIDLAAKIAKKLVKIR